jgi:hypothetical protein
MLCESAERYVPSSNVQYICVLLSTEEYNFELVCGFAEEVRLLFLHYQ